MLTRRRLGQFYLFSEAVIHFLTLFLLRYISLQREAVDASNFNNWSSKHNPSLGIVNLVRALCTS